MESDFRRDGRMLPEGVVYQAGWDDLVDFEIVPILTSAEYWATIPGD